MKGESTPRRNPFKAESPSFGIWYQQLELLAAKYGVELGPRREYREYFDDGDTPLETLVMETGRKDIERE